MVTINGETRICYLIGNPVRHTLSPYIHNKLFKMYGINMVYLAFRVESRDLMDVVNMAKILDSPGFNVTMPYKTSVIKYIDKMDREAERIKAINTVIQQGKVTYGYNTDLYALIDAIRDSMVKIEGSTATIIGAGGVAKVSFYAASKLGAERINVVNRTPSHAYRLIKMFRDFPGEKHVYKLGSEEAKSVIRQSDIVINATPLGMEYLDKPPFDIDLLGEQSLIIDYTYKKGHTKLIEAALSKGLRFIDGIELLLRQAFKSFTLWTGIQPNVKPRKEFLGEYIGGR